MRLKSRQARWSPFKGAFHLIVYEPNPDTLLSILAGNQHPP